MLNQGKEPRVPREKMMSLRFRQEEYDLLENLATRKHNYTSSYCRSLLLSAIEAETAKEVSLQAV